MPRLQGSKSISSRLLLTAHISILGGSGQKMRLAPKISSTKIAPLPNCSTWRHLRNDLLFLSLPPACVRISLSCSPVPSPAPPSSSPSPVEAHCCRRPLLLPSLFLGQICSFWSQSQPSPVLPDSVWRRLPPTLRRPTSVQRCPPPVPPESIRRHPPLCRPTPSGAVPLGILIVSLPSFFLLCIVAPAILKLFALLPHLPLLFFKNWGQICKY
jgi:hypothetical protein